MKIVVIIQARMGSTRLPGKVMRRLGSASVLGHVIRRTRACALADEVIVATTERPQDDAIVAESQRHDAAVYRGSENDVLDRYYCAATSAGADTVVRVTSDCPLFDPVVLGQMLVRFIERSAGATPPAYLSNTLVRTYPRGLDAEVFTAGALRRAFRESHLPYEREHVTPYVYRHPELFTLESFVNETDLSHHRWTLDTEDDFQLLKEIYGTLDHGEEIFSTQAVLDFLAARPELLRLNAHVQQKPLGG
jgi:spore coat polysaccharide biosynthesis protein SpsF